MGPDTHFQNVRFGDDVPDWDVIVNSKPDPTYSTGSTNDTMLSNFFSRPIRIQNYSWAPGANFFETFNPWDDYFRNTRVQNRIANYNLLSCRLHVKFLINGNSFYYGKIMPSYLPLHGLDDLTLTRALIPQDMISASQRPHGFLDPTESQGLTMQLPFVYPTNAVSIPQAGWAALGLIHMFGLTPLKHANGSTDPLTISVFAWAEDVNMSILTSVNPAGLLPQSGGDEYGTGPISVPANAVSKLSGALESAPGIGPYATATRMAASAIAAVAKAFGYSNPVNVEPSKPFVPQLIGNMSNINMTDSSVKLTLDVKQELSISTCSMGLGGEDEMSIKSIAQRESYLTSFPWTTARLTDDFLFQLDVTPVIWDTDSATGNELHFPACCFAALPFQYWRGTMRYRFQIVASAFHKGRLKITYDPVVLDSNEFNTNYVYIADVATDKDFTLDVAWGQEVSMIGSLNPNTDVPPFISLIPITTGQGKSNGVLTVHVLTELTTPNATVDNDIAINVFVSAGSDFEVYDPMDDKIEPLTWFLPQSGFVPQSAEADPPPEDNAPTISSSKSMLSSVDAPKGTDLVYFGDPITSFRQCMKRYNVHSAVAPSATGDYWLRYKLNNFPYYRGNVPGAVTPVSVGNYNFSKMTLLNYVTPAYTCWRGGLRWKHVLTGSQKNSTNTQFFSATRLHGTGGFDILESVVEDMTSSQGKRMEIATRRIGSTHSGTHWSTLEQNPVLEVELPFHRNRRFAQGKQADYTSPSTLDEFHITRTIWSANTNSSPYILSSVAAGEDFTLGFFTGCPVAWNEARGPTPA